MIFCLYNLKALRYCARMMNANSNLKGARDVRVRVIAEGREQEILVRVKPGQDVFEAMIGSIQRGSFQSPAPRQEVA